MEYFLELLETIVAIIDNAERLEYVEKLPIVFVQQTVSNNGTILFSFQSYLVLKVNEFWIIYQWK